MPQWELIKEDNNSRTYRNSQTFTETTTTVIYNDAYGNKWYGFKDLFAIPFMRTQTAKIITDLFQIGLTAKDVQTWISKEKEILKSNDSEKYEKLYSLILEKEAAISNAVNPQKHYLGLATVYILAQDERIDIYNESKATEKLNIWQSDIEAMSFFLTWVLNNIESSQKVLSRLTEIAMSPTL